MTTNELTFPLSGLKPAMRTDPSKGTVTNKDAALLILAANGGVLPKATVQALLRGWRPLEGKNPNSELCFTYLFNEYYGHITSDYDQAEPRRGYAGGQAHYSSGPYMWRPARATAAVSALGRERLKWLVASFAANDKPLAPEVNAFVPEALLLSILVRFASRENEGNL